MGIKGFSKTFVPRIIKQKDLKNLTGALDASVILYQSCLGMSIIKGLTDSSGTPTLHINVIIARVLNFIKSSVGQVWVFDYHEANYTSPDKEIELAKRRKRKADAKKKIATLKKKQEEKKTGKKTKQTDGDLFTDSDEDADDDDATEKKINQQEKITFTMNEQIVNDCKFILDCFDICWCIAPKGTEAEKICPVTGLPMIRIGEEISEQLAYEPGRIYAIRYIRPKYVSPDRRNGNSVGVKTAPLPDGPIDRCKADVSLLTHIMISKFCDHLPLHRQHGMFARHGIELAESTMGGWIKSLGNNLEPLYDLHRSTVLSCDYLNADDTPILFVRNKKKRQKE